MNYARCVCVLILTLVPNYGYAGTIEFMEVKDNLVTFSTSEIKAHTSPACAVEETKQKWTIKINTPTGRATYTMLMTAVATGMEVKVETAGDCAFKQGIERAKRIWLVK
ncbi:hypothetical protein [Paraglaciecola sp.]|uniref:hypothetical protein n=1 Tax=Paraglaciecola sp. TaxID=1920173 RepID=UPI003EF7FD94